jgi:hypothetical protein
MIKRIVLTFSYLAIAATFLATSFMVFMPARSADALLGSEFNPGNIVDDSVFYNQGGIDAGGIQSFLASKVSSCDTNGTQMIYDPSQGDTVTRKVYSERRGYTTPFTCLKDYRQDVPNVAADAYCSAFGAGNKSAADIIYEVSANCGINARVLIVQIQKEQSLVTDSWPWSKQYRSATGYGCPDSNVCDAQYYGFFNQVYRAARQFKIYKAFPNSFNYRSGRVNTILWHPDAGRCGTSQVYIENFATAALYNYTPYRPNQAALNNLYGTGDSCSSYGNRNFWRIFNDWFGATYGNTIGPNAHRLYYSPTGDHLFTANEYKRSQAKQQGYRDDQPLVFKVGETQQAGMVPIYSLYNGRLNDNWLLPDGMNLYWGAVHGGYAITSVAFYAYPASPTPPVCPADTYPVYQTWHGGSTDHFYTKSGNERYWALIYGGYVDDGSSTYKDGNGGISFCVPI